MAVELEKSHRKRKRSYFNAIRAQMEFYFGDANLSKDRFLRQEIDKDPFVPLELFMSFNKIKKMVTCVEDIAKSLTNSKLLELDHTQQKVRRKTAIPAERNVDEKTLYIESLPATADHDWIRQAFERFGPITYVSLPKYKRTQKIKQFAFVEFENECSIEKAITYFNEFNGVLSIGETEPGELISVKSYIKEQNNEEDIDTDVDDKLLKKTVATNIATAATNMKRRKSNTTTSEDDDEDENESKNGASKAKKLKTEALNNSEHTTATETETENDATFSTDEVNDAKNSSAPTAATKIKKKRQRKKKKKKKSDLYNRNAAIFENDNEAVNNEQAFHELRILSKRDWKKIRNKYLNLQREKVGQLKRKDWEEQRQAKNKIAKQQTLEGLDAVATLTPTAKKTKPNERKLQKMNMNFYGAGGGEDDAQTKPIIIPTIKEVKQNRALESSPLFNYEPGLIIELNMKEPCVNVKDFKAEMRQNTNVQYVDIKEGALVAYIRLKSPLAVENFMRQLSFSEYQCKVLTGEVECEYWKKIERDREMKLNKQVKVPTKRGREKVKKLITKHIRFGDEDE